jgi:hypothetical protein
VKPAEARHLFDLLRAAYPRENVGPRTAELWVDELRPLSPELGEQAVRGVIASCRSRWPTLAELNEHVEIARRQAAQERQARERREAEQLAEDEHTKRLRIGLEHAYRWLDRHDTSIGPPDQPEGDCDECHRTVGRRYSLGQFVLCRECRTRRLRAGLVAEGKAKPRGEPRRPELLGADRPRTLPALPVREARTTCRICGTELGLDERPEGFCDDCLRGQTARSSSAGLDERDNDAGKEAERDGA